jgi:hypothetical protein
MIILSEEDFVKVVDTNDMSQSINHFAKLIFLYYQNNEKNYYDYYG